MASQIDLYDGIKKLLTEVAKNPSDRGGVNESYVRCALVLLEKMDVYIDDSGGANGSETENEKSDKEVRGNTNENRKQVKDYLKKLEKRFENEDIYI